jgi:hypothetical protein
LAWCAAITAELGNTVVIMYVIAAIGFLDDQVLNEPVRAGRRQHL